MDNKEQKLAIIQDYITLEVLTFVWMNDKSVALTESSGLLHVLDQVSGENIAFENERDINYKVISIKENKNNTGLLILVKIKDEVTTLDFEAGWDLEIAHKFGVFLKLEKVINDRKINPKKRSTISPLFKKGTKKIAQKLGEEAAELIIEAIDENDELFLEEAADLMFYFLMLLNTRNFRLNDVLNVLEQRNRK